MLATLLIKRCQKWHMPQVSNVGLTRRHWHGELLRRRWAGSLLPTCSI